MTKEKLEQYRQICREIEELEREKEAWANGRSGSDWLGDPRRNEGCHSDPTGQAAAHLWELSCMLAARLNELIALRLEIEQAIVTLPPDERRIIRLYYVEGHTLESVAELVGYSVRHLWRKRKEILQKLALV